MSTEEKKTILVVDDVKLFQLFIKQTLTSEDYKLIFVETGGAAIDMVMKKGIDLLILDVELPDMNGLEVLRSIRKLTEDMQSVVEMKDLPVIMVTAYPREEIQREAERMGLVSFVGKPIKRKELRQLVDDILEGRYQKSGRRKLILCVDSEPRVQKFYRGTLSDYDWDVITASNGVEALERVEFKNPHLILTELNLPEMDGVELIQMLNESNSDVPVMVVSSVSEKEGRQKLQGLKIKKYLTKPFQLDELKRNIKEILEEEASV